MSSSSIEFCERCGIPGDKQLCDSCLLQSVRMPFTVELTMKQAEENKARLESLIDFRPRVLYGD